MAIEDHIIRIYLNWIFIKFYLTSGLILRILKKIPVLLDAMSMFLDKFVFKVLS